MKKYLSLFILLFALTAHCQIQIAAPPKHSQYRVNLTFTPQLYLNGINVENDGIAPEGISTRNTGGFTTGIEIERKSKTGFLLNFGVQYGTRHHSITMGYESLAFFEPNLEKALSLYGPQKEHYSGNTSYVNFRLLAGYVFPIKILHGYNIEIKAGPSVKTYNSELYNYYYRGLLLINNGMTFDGKIGEGHVRLGAHDPFQSWWKAVECYVGIKKELNTKYLKNICIGIEFTRALFFKSEINDDGYLYSYTLSGGNKPISTDKYVSKDFAIGLRLCAGLWHR